MLIIKKFINFYVEFKILLHFMCFRVFTAKENDSEEPECKQNQDCIWTTNHITWWSINLIKLLILSINVVELVLSFPTNFKSTQSEFGWRNYGQNTISVQQNSKSTVRNSVTHLLPVPFQLVTKITIRNSKIADHNYWQLEREFLF
jgi:hypothetical protein